MRTKATRDSRFPEEYRELLRYLKQAIEKDEVREAMVAEDEIIEEFQALERAIAYKDGVIEENAKTLEEKDKSLEEKDRLIQDLQRKLEEKQ